MHQEAMVFLRNFESEFADEVHNARSIKKEHFLFTNCSLLSRPEKCNGICILCITYAAITALWKVISLHLHMFVNIVVSIDQKVFQLQLQLQEQPLMNSRLLLVVLSKDS